MKARHFTELREAINAMRTAVGLAPFQWSGAAPQVSGAIYASHFNDLRANLFDALDQLDLPVPQFAAVAKDDPVTSEPIEQLRELTR